MKYRSRFKYSPSFINRALIWLERYEYGLYLNPNSSLGEYPGDRFLHCMAVSNHALDMPVSTNWEQLKIHYQTDWLFGHLSYELKNLDWHLSSANKSLIQFNDWLFFKPEVLLFFDDAEVIIESDEDPQKIFEIISAIQVNKPSVYTAFSKIQSLTAKEDYIQNVTKILNHIEEGDCYELNYCMAYSIPDLKLDPVHYYQKLTAISPTPFSCLYKVGSRYCLSASPERFLQKKGDLLRSQPMKGTVRKGGSKAENDALKKALAKNKKERAENMMIVDLVRNDLARSSVAGSVKVPDLFGVYSFEHWNQMISTVESKLHPEIHPIDAIRNAFPMGSMTGAPKVKVMQLIDELESFNRGLYSGSIGFIQPNGDFDFNVVIRSFLYDKSLNQGAFMVGSAITYDSDPEMEYEECQLKIEPLIKALEQTKNIE